MPNRPGNMSDREDRAPATPYGPHRGHVDEAAGGADSSPYDTTAPEERSQIAREQQEKDLRKQGFDQPQP